MKYSDVKQKFRMDFESQIGEIPSDEMFEALKEKLKFDDTLRTNKTKICQLRLASIGLAILLCIVSSFLSILIYKNLELKTDDDQTFNPLMTDGLQNPIYEYFHKNYIDYLSNPVLIISSYNNDSLSIYCGIEQKNGSRKLQYYYHFNNLLHTNCNCIEFNNVDTGEKQILPVSDDVHVLSDYLTISNFDDIKCSLVYSNQVVSQYFIAYNDLFVSIIK
mgnify:CR=1 FL=1